MVCCKTSTLIVAESARDELHTEAECTDWSGRKLPELCLKQRFIKSFEARDNVRTQHQAKILSFQNVGGYRIFLLTDLLKQNPSWLGQQFWSNRKSDGSLNRDSVLAVADGGTKQKLTVSSSAEPEETPERTKSTSEKHLQQASWDLWQNLLSHFYFVLK